jgi:hypothetical protein
MLSHTSISLVTSLGHRAIRIARLMKEHAGDLQQTASERGAMSSDTSTKVVTVQALADQFEVQLQKDVAFAARDVEKQKMQEIIKEIQDAAAGIKLAIKTTKGSSDLRRLAEDLEVRSFPDSEHDTS